MKAFIAIVALFVMADSADACNRCGLFGNRCRFKSAQVTVKRVYYPQQQPQQLITIQNNYNGSAALTSPISQQGQTVYGYSALSQAYMVNPEAILNQAARLTENAQNLADKGFQQYTSAATLQINGQTEVAKILAATAHLKAATATSSTQSITVRTQNGKAEVTTQPPATQSTQPGELPAPLPQGPAAAPAAFQSCVKCHSGATPKGQLSLDRDSFDCETIVKSLSRIAGLDPEKSIMPPPDSGIVLSQQEKGEIMQFLLKSKETPVPQEPQP